MSTLRVDELRVDGLKPVSLTIAAGECVALCGPSGTGKTRLLRAIVDLDCADGDVVLNGLSRSRMGAAEWRRAVGFLTSENAWWRGRVAEHFERIDEAALQALGLHPNVLAQLVDGLSTGEKQRLALLRLTANRPQALLLDEPTASLDPANVSRTESFLERYRLRMRAPMIWVTHDPSQAARIASRVLQVENGQLVTASERKR